MNKKLIAGIGLGIIAMLLGVLWFLQGIGVVHLRPILCFADCKPLTGKSPEWQVTGTIAFVVGAIVAGACARRASRQRKN